MRPLNGARADPIPSIVAAEVRRLIGEGYPIAHIAKVTGVSRETLILTPGMNTAPERDLTGRLMGDRWPGRREIIERERGDSGVRPPSPLNCQNRASWRVRQSRLIPPPGTF